MAPTNWIEVPNLWGAIIGPPSAMKSPAMQSARSILAGLQKDEDDEPPCPRIVVNDATVEKLGELLNENPRGLLLMRDELPGFLARMESEEYASERAFYLEAFNGSGRFASLTDYPYIRKVRI